MGRSISIHALLAESDQILDDMSGATKHFYPRSPCGERHNINSSVNTADQISIHALLAESDVSLLYRITITVDISIHALLAESDLTNVVSSAGTTDFYPRSPCGERRNTRNSAETT